ncbi:hypothetical protein Scep_015540 [Stephania cephalantha]|uniref:Bifunctional inhibitor/plant lipid transfer protein/seed storage helical domain-containing protein n=1 Tax=Stephania cephalantha TaxID=152367 RepID=A0AAP0J3D6_9MAGN
MVKVTMMSVVMGMLMMAVVVAGKGHHLNHHHHHQRKSASAPAPSTDCSTIIYDMMDCVGYVTAGSNVTEPSKECCTGFKTVLKTDAECVCEAIKESAEMGIAVNNTRAKGLPSACGESSAPDCGFPDSGDSPSASPVAPPESSPSATPSTVAPSPSDEELSGGSPAPSSISSAYTTAFSFAFAVFGLVLSAL